MPGAQREFGLLEVGKWQALAKNFLIGFVTLACNKHHVVSARLGNRDTDGLGTVDDALNCGTCPSRCWRRS